MRYLIAIVPLFLPTLGSGCVRAPVVDPTWAAYEQEYKAAKGNRTQSEGSALILYQVTDY